MAGQGYQERPYTAIRVATDLVRGASGARRPHQRCRHAAGVTRRTISTQGPATK